MISADTAVENSSWLRGPIGGNGYYIGDLAAKEAMEYLSFAALYIILLLKSF